MVEDDKGYVTNGIEIDVTVLSEALVRTKISNFASDATSNPRVSMKIARDGSVPDIYIRNDDRKSLVTEGMTIKLKAEELPSTLEPDDVQFQYKVSDAGVDPRDDNDWIDIDTDARGVVHRVPPVELYKVVVPAI